MNDCMSMCVFVCVCVCVSVCVCVRVRDSACVGCQKPHCLVTDNETATTIRTCIPIFSQRVLPPLLSSPHGTILPVPVKWKPTHAENLARVGHSLPSPQGLQPDQPVSHFSSSLSVLHSLSHTSSFWESPFALLSDIDLSSVARGSGLVRTGLGVNTLLATVSAQLS